jgi:hypothetical protein
MYMTEYGINIQPDIYYNQRMLYVTETSGQDKYLVPLKLTLNSSNFNFDTTRQDGLDFRITEVQNGTNVLQMWIAYWDYTANIATIWFKLPFLAANETKTLYVFWGNDGDIGDSSLKYMLGESVGGGATSTPIFLFGDDFEYDVLNSNKWFSSGSVTIFNSKISLGLNAWIKSVEVLKHTTNVYTGDPISLVMFDGLYCSSSGSWDGTMNTGAGFLCDNVLDGDGKSFVEDSRLGFELGSVKDNVSQIHVYCRTDDGFGNPGADITDWVDDDNNFINIYGSTTNSGYGYIDVYSHSGLPIIYKDGPVCAFEILFPPTGENFRYCYIYNNIDALKVTTVSGIQDLYITEFKAFRQDAYSSLDEVKWIIEEGITGVGSPTNTSYYVHGYELLGGDNEMKILYYWDDDVDRKHNFELGGDVSIYAGASRGLEIGSYSQNYIAYYEATDKVYQGMYYRDDLDNYDDTWERKVHRNTELDSFKIHGYESTTSNGVEIDWVIAREYTLDDELEIDYSELYIPYEEIPPQPLDFTEYTSDMTGVNYYHSSDMGGDPYKLSDNTTGSLTNIFSSDVTTSGSVLIDFGRKNVNLVSSTYSHYDNNRIPYYNASKLSDFDTDRLSRDYWECTTSSGVWAAIKFPSPIMVGCLVVKAVDSKLDGMIKDFNFYGSNIDPRLVSSEGKYLLYTGTFSAVLVKQSIHFTTNSRLFKYYILEAINSYGDNVALQEWEMYELDDTTSKKAVSQIRLHPAAFEANEYYFPKNIELYASNNLIDWVKLLDTIRTYTPFYDMTYGRWQRYSISNDTAYYSYKLVCLDNWNASEDRIKIDEWEMVTKVAEEDNFRILNGELSVINNIWADPTTTFEEGNVYITNDKFNVVMHNTLIESTTVSGVVSDMNIRL